jgi:CRP-like cAMP-binding protein
VIRPRIAVLEGLGLFAHASRAALEKLADAAVEVEAPAGEAIVREGQPADALYVLVDGSVQVSAAGELGGLARPIRTMTGPTYFGEIGLLRQIPRTATVTTSTPCRLYRIDGKAFLDALTTSPASPSMLEGAKTRLVITHPSYRGVPEAPVPAGA